MLGNIFPRCLAGSIFNSVIISFLKFNINTYTQSQIQRVLRIWIAWLTLLNIEGEGRDDLWGKEFSRKVGEDVDAVLCWKGICGFLTIW